MLVPNTSINGSMNRGVNRTGGNAATSAIMGLAPAAWYRYGIGITVAGAGVDTWADQSGNARDLRQTTDTNRPALQADNSILFDGVDNYMATGAFTFNQPVTYYLLVNQVSWTNTDRIADGVGNNTRVAQSGVTPQIVISATSALAANANLAVGAYGVLATVFNGASSVCQVNNTTPVTGDVGANNPGGFTLGSSASGASNWANIQVKEVILYAAAHDAATRARVIRYLAAVGQIAV